MQGSTCSNGGVDKHLQLLWQADIGQDARSVACVCKAVLHLIGVQPCMMEYSICPHCPSESILAKTTDYKIASAIMLWWLLSVESSAGSDAF